MNIIGERINIARRKAGLTQKELGEKIGVTDATINRYESGEIKNIPPDKLLEITNETHVSLLYLYGADTDINEKYLNLTEENKRIVNEMIDVLLKIQNEK